MMSYRIEMNADDNGMLLVTCPDLPEVTTFGVDVEDARRHALEAIEEAIAARIDAGVPLPQPKRHGAQRPVTLPLLTRTQSAALYHHAKRRRHPRRVGAETRLASRTS